MRRWLVPMILLAVGACQAPDPLDAEAAARLREGASYFDALRAKGIDPTRGRIFDEAGRKPFKFGEWTIRCATVKLDPEAPDPAHPPSQRAILSGSDAHVETELTGRWFDHLWKKAGC